MLTSSLPILLASIRAAKSRFLGFFRALLLTDPPEEDPIPALPVGSIADKTEAPSALVYKFTLAEGPELATVLTGTGVDIPSFPVEGDAQAALALDAVLSYCHTRLEI